ncbi:nuclear transport factor 2 family protein [Mycolicibacterium neworleansense]|uniref:Ketosteroid isomerase-like protein n=1 Tax=Mycolicibacterium neworleansense TaxID=146018 RepID=A0A0H5RT28_9MYCO|nr:nuclear transport factor 2 family protein [Mycolicibacterium neworleansense]MCV7360087.1 nuclear transport factor 2 family protein [Mycolicibacterium neworleansense]CRZ17310.1 ketosteroid isomerase-like protein [Mycolicibacterium neworleansense]
MNRATEALFERYHAAWVGHDPDAIAGMHSVGSVFHVHTGQEPAHGREAIRQSAAHVFELVPDLGFEPVSLRVGEDYWVAEWKMTGTTSAGVPVEIDLVDVVSVEDGLVAGKQSYVDGAAMRAAMGG